MKTFPLQSLTIIEAQQKQFTLVDSICRHFPGAEFLTSGDLGLTPGLNQPRITQRVEQVLADAFHAPAAALVQGAGTGAIRAALAALLKPGQRLLVHDAPVYPTTRVIIEQMGLTLITADFNDLSALKQVVDEQQPDAALVQHTRQQPQDSYVLADVLATLRAAGVPALTDDNYAVMKVARIGCECGANVSTFSCFKLFGPEGVGAVVGDADVINRIRATLYSGGSQIQGSQALEVLRGLVFAPVMHAVQAGVSERLLALLNGGAVAEDSHKFDTSREIAAYLDQEGVKYAVKTDRENYDLFVLTYTPSTSKELDKIAIQVYAYEDSAVVIGADLLQPDTSNLLKLYQNLESMNDSVSFVRFMYDTDIEAIYPQVDIPYVEDAAFGNMVERYIYITALVVDQNYDGMTALFQ